MHRILFAATAALAVVASPAAAQERYEVRIVYGDLDLSTQAGADRMLQRIGAAARDVCDTNGLTTALRQQERVCANEFTRRALAELDRAVPQRMFAQNEPNAEIEIASR